MDSSYEDKLNERYKRVFRRHISKINAEMDPNGTILDEFFEYGKISLEDKKSIEKIESKAERARTFMNLMFEKSNPGVFVFFRCVLSSMYEYEWIIEAIDKEMREQEGRTYIGAGGYGTVMKARSAAWGGVNFESVPTKRYVLSYENGQLDAGLVSSREKLPEEIHNVEFRVSDKSSIPVQEEITNYLEKSPQWSSLAKLLPRAQTKIQTVLEDCYSLGRCLHAAWKDFKSLNAGVHFALSAMNILSNEGVRVTKRIQDSIQTLVESVMSEVVSRVKSEKKIRKNLQ